MKDVIEDEHNGLLVKPAHTGELVAALERMIGSSERRARLGQAAQETMKRYTWARVGEQLEKVFALAVAAT
jgi:glycosyltransferase involved in cell wall biosynthesis